MHDGSAAIAGSRQRRTRRLRSGKSLMPVQASRLLDRVEFDQLRRRSAEHCVERGDHLTHHRHDDDLRLLSGCREAIMENPRFIDPQVRLTMSR
jgi:hypothetical protein